MKFSTSLVSAASVAIASAQGIPGYPAPSNGEPAGNGQTISIYEPSTDAAATEPTAMYPPPGQTTGDANAPPADETDYSPPIISDTGAPLPPYPSGTDSPPYPVPSGTAPGGTAPAGTAPAGTGPSTSDATIPYPTTADVPSGTAPGTTGGGVVPTGGSSECAPVTVTVSVTVPAETPDTTVTETETLTSTLTETETVTAPATTEASSTGVIPPYPTDGAPYPTGGETGGVPGPSAPATTGVSEVASGTGSAYPLPSDNTADGNTPPSSGLPPYGSANNTVVAPTGTAPIELPKPTSVEYPSGTAPAGPVSPPTDGAPYPTGAPTVPAGPTGTGAPALPTCFDTCFKKFDATKQSLCNNPEVNACIGTTCSAEEAAQYNSWRAELDCPAPSEGSPEAPTDAAPTDVYPSQTGVEVSPVTDSPSEAVSSAVDQITATYDAAELTTALPSASAAPVASAVYSEIIADLPSSVVPPAATAMPELPATYPGDEASAEEGWTPGKVIEWCASKVKELVGTGETKPVKRSHARDMTI